MNGNDLMRAMNGIDGRYLAEVQTESKKKPHFRKSVTTAVMILLAATLTTVTAAAGWHLLHPETVEHYMKSGSVQKMETAGMVLNQTVENDYFRLTAESIVWDGKMGRIFYTLQPKTDAANEKILETETGYVIGQTGETTPVYQWRVFSAALYYSDTKQEVIGMMGLGFNDPAYQSSESLKPGYFDFVCNDNLDFSRPIELRCSSQYLEDAYLWEGLSIPVNLYQTNEKSVNFTCEDACITVSSIGMWSADDSLYMDKAYPSSWKMILRDGTELVIDRGWNPVSDPNPEHILQTANNCNSIQRENSICPNVSTFCEFLNVDDVEALEIKGKRYNRAE